MFISTQDILVRVFVAFALSFIFGLERQFRKKPVGFGTFTFVTVGACVLSIVAQTVSETPIVLFGAIMTGIGFLGAGAIIKGNDHKVQGITTAAALWAFASLGITIGIGLYIISGIFFVMIGVIIGIDHYFENHGFGSYSRRVSVTVREASRIKDIEKMLPSHKILSYTFDNDKKEYLMHFYINGNKREINMTLNELIRQPSVLKVTVD